MALSHTHKEFRISCPSNLSSGQYGGFLLTHHHALCSMRRTSLCPLLPALGASTGRPVSEGQLHHTAVHTRGKWEHVFGCPVVLSNFYNSNNNNLTSLINLSGIINSGWAVLVCWSWSLQVVKEPHPLFCNGFNNVYDCEGIFFASSCFQSWESAFTLWTLCLKKIEKRVKSLVF